MICSKFTEKYYTVCHVPERFLLLSDLAERVDMNLPCYDATVLSAMTFLDAEVTFHILSEDKKDLIEKISEYTAAKFAPINEADFVIVLREDTEDGYQKCYTEM